MNLTGCKVKHKVYGTGIVVEQDEYLEIVDENFRYCNVKYAPFDKHGNGNRGYLYDIDPKLVSVFLKGAIAKNREIADLDYVQWLI